MLAATGIPALDAGRAGIIRAEKEGDAAVLRAQAELTRARAEVRRAEKGLAPLPAPYIPPSDAPPASPARPTGGAGSTE